MEKKNKVATAENNKSLERLEGALVQLGFSLEQQEARAEEVRKRYEEKVEALIMRIENLEVKIHTLLSEKEDEED